MMRVARREGPDTAVLEGLGRLMVRSRVVEEATLALWEQGRISGELHLGIGEEAVAAGVVAHLREGDGIATDHRPTAPFVARGIPVEAILRELLGDDEGLCAGWGGHMHLLSREHLAVSDGIVGASGPLACGFALAASRLRSRSVAVAFFGEGAVNQGMLMEAFNLAVVWKLPVVFVCKDSGWAITTHSADVTAGDPVGRAAAFGMPAVAVDGADVGEVWRTAGGLVDRARDGKGPGFVLARVHRPQGHLADDPVLRILREPIGQGRELGPGMVAALGRRGASAGTRARALSTVTRRFGLLGAELTVSGRHDPIRALSGRVADLDGMVRAARAEVADVLARIAGEEVAP